MHRFYVHQRRPMDNLVALRDGEGKFHSAPATADLPAVGAELMGVSPQLGFSLLLGASTDRVYRVKFELMNLESAVTTARQQS